MLENYDPIILVTRGDELPKKNYEKKLHPTYETSIRLANGSQRHLVVKFFDQYRTLNENLEKMGIGHGLAFPIDAEFPPTHKTSIFGLGLSEDALQQRCYMLNKWMQAVFNNYHILPEKAQLLISEFLSLEDEDEAREKNKNYILDMIKKKNEIKLPDFIDKMNQQQAALGEDSSKQDVVEEPPLVLTPELISEISEPQVVNDFLLVHVTRQNVESRNRYETKVNMLAFDELNGENISNKALIDSIQYNQQVNNLPPLVINKPFDGYRQLKYALQDNGIFGRDKTERWNNFNEDSTKAYRGLKLEAEFPKTYAQSAFGLGLTEDQLKTRGALLNRWVIAVLKTYKQFNPQGQEVVREFFELDDIDNAQHQIYLSILNGVYEPPKLPPPSTKGGSEGTPARRTSLLASVLGGGGSSNSPSTNPPAAPTSNAASYAPVSISAAPKANSSRLVTETRPGENEDDGRYSEMRMSTLTESPSPTNPQLADLQKETIVRNYLNVSVTKGDMLAKKKDEGKKHHGYLTTVRILYLEEVDVPEKAKIDPDAYSNNVSMLPAKKVLKVFDGYRQLKTQLEEKNIFSLDSKEKAKDRPDAIVIQAAFPRTYTRSSLGLSLGENEIKTRTAELNNWLGKVLARYGDLPGEAQELLDEFLNLDDSPAEAENRVILSILKGTFNPPLIQPKPKKPSFNGSADGAGNGNGPSTGAKRGSTGGFAASGGGNGGQNGNRDQVQPVAQGCACVIM